MILAACFLVHGHVGMPLFVIPITLFAYISLLLRLRVGKSARWVRPWRVFPKAHWAASGIILVFLIPIVTDLVASHPSNLRTIVEHLQNSYGEKKGILRSILYLTHFAAYAPYPNSNFIPAFGDFDIPGSLHFVGRHWRAYGLWLVAILGPLFLARERLGFPARRDKTVGDVVARPEVDKILSESYVVTGIAIGLTIAWG